VLNGISIVGSCVSSVYGVVSASTPSRPYITFALTGRDVSRLIITFLKLLVETSGCSVMRSCGGGGNDGMGDGDGDGLGSGDGEGLGDGDGFGVGLGLGLGLGEGDGDGLGEGEGLGLGVGVGLGEGDGLGAGGGGGGGVEALTVYVPVVCTPFHTLLPSLARWTSVPVKTFTVPLPLAMALNVICIKLKLLALPAPNVTRVTWIDPDVTELSKDESSGVEFSVWLTYCSFVAS